MCRLGAEVQGFQQAGVLWPAVHVQKRSLRRKPRRVGLPWKDLARMWSGADSSATLTRKKTSSSTTVSADYSSPRLFASMCVSLPHPSSHALCVPSSLFHTRSSRSCGRKGVAPGASDAGPRGLEQGCETLIPRNQVEQNRDRLRRYVGENVEVESQVRGVGQHSRRAGAEPDSGRGRESQHVHSRNGWWSSRVRGG